MAPVQAENCVGRVTVAGRFTLVGSLFGVERAICDMLSTSKYECPHGCKKHIQGFSALADHKSLFRLEAKA